MAKIGILLGSSRQNGNSIGIREWVVHHLHSIQTASHYHEFEIVDIFPQHPLHPLGPIMDEVIPAMAGIGDYGSDSVNAWSRLVSSCQGFIIITPQHNWGYPGELKTALDHLYAEWKDKPVIVVTCGGHGGGKCNQQLREVLQGFKMKIAEENICISLPSEYIRGNERVRAAETNHFQNPHSFLTEQETALTRAIHQFLQYMQRRL